MDTNKTVEVVATEDIRKKIQKLDELIDQSTIKFPARVENFFEGGKLINYGTPFAHSEETLATRTGLPLEAVREHCKNRGHYSPLYRANANAKELDYAVKILAKAYQEKKHEAENELYSFEKEVKNLEEKLKQKENIMSYYKENRDIFKSFNDELVKKVKTLKAELKCAKYNAARNSDLYVEALKELNESHEHLEKKRHVSFCIGVAVGAALFIGLALIFIR